MDDYTYAPKGESRIALQGFNDKRGNTATITVTKSGKLLPFQLIWSGKTIRSIPNCEWPEGFLNCFSGPSSKGNSHGTKWQNEKTILEYLTHIVIPYVEACRNDPTIKSQSELYEQGLNSLLVMDHHWSHLSGTVEKTLRDKNIPVALIPKKATDLFSVLDVSINRPYKAYLKKAFAELITADVVKQTKAGISADNIKVDLRASRIKPNCGSMITKAYMHLKKNEKTCILNGFRKVCENIENAILKSQKQGIAPTPSILPPEDLKVMFAKDPERIWYVKDIAKCRIFRFEGVVHFDEILDHQVSVVVTEVLKNCDLPYPSSDLRTFADAKGSFAKVDQSWLTSTLQTQDLCEDEGEHAYEEIYITDEDSDDEEVQIQAPANLPEVLYCVCRIPEPDENNLSSPMIACDYCGEWFHWRCVKHAPEAPIPDEDNAWFCEVCNAL
jgi:hypothetical protein